MTTNSNWCHSLNVMDKVLSHVSIKTHIHYTMKSEKQFSTKKVCKWNEKKSVFCLCTLSAGWALYHKCRVTNRMFEQKTAFAETYRHPGCRIVSWKKLILLIAWLSNMQELLDNQAVKFYDCLDCPSCLVHLKRVSWAIWAATKKHNLNIIGDNWLFWFFSKYSCAVSSPLSHLPTQNLLTN